MKKLFEKLIIFVRSLFCKETLEQEVENSYLIPLEITDIRVDKYRNDTFHLKISFPLEYKEEIENIVINIQGDKKETGYIQCEHLTYDEPIKI